MPSLRANAWILSAGLLALTACKNELDDKPAADPLEDPWVNAIDTGDDEPAMAAVEPVPGSAEPVNADAVALADPQAAAPTELATGVVASPSANPSPSSATGPASPGAAKPGAAGEPAAAGEPSAAGEPAVAPEPGAAPSEQPGAAEPVPVADPTPAPAPAAEPAKPAAPPPITIADFHGNYRFVGGSSQREGLEAAIEEAASQLPGAIRGIGRRRLSKTNRVDNTLDIVVAGDKVTTIFESGFDAGCVVDGATVHWTSSKGDKYKVRVRAKGSKLVQIIVGEDGVKTTVFVLSADRQKLTVHHKITADRLPEPMTYRLSYARK